MDLLITTMLLLVGGLLAFALVVAGWEAVQRSITEQLARQAAEVDAAALERPFLPSTPPVAAEAAPASEADARKAVAAHVLHQAARSAAAQDLNPAHAANPSDGGRWIDTEPMAVMTLGPAALDTQAIHAARQGVAGPQEVEPSVVESGLREVDLALH